MDIDEVDLAGVGGCLGTFTPLLLLTLGHVYSEARDRGPKLSKRSEHDLSCRQMAVDGGERHQRNS